MQLVISFESIGSRILQNLCMQSVVRQVQTTEILTGGRNFTPHPGDSVEAQRFTPSSSSWGRNAQTEGSKCDSKLRDRSKLCNRLTPFHEPGSTAVVHQWEPFLRSIIITNECFLERQNELSIIKKCCHKWGLNSRLLSKTRIL